jgi:hypothetical protein
MQIARDLKLFGLSLWKAWWALMSCAAFTILGLFIALENKGNSWTVGGIIVLAVTFFACAAFMAWREKYLALTKLQRRLASPQIDLSVGSAWWGADKNDSLSVILTMQVFNPHGPPTAMFNWELSLQLESDGIVTRGEIPLDSPSDIPLHLPNGQTLGLRKDAELRRQASVQPIPAGGLAEGWLMAVFRGIGPSQLVASRHPLLNISAMDVATRRQHSITFDFPTRGQGVTLPGIGKV